MSKGFSSFRSQTIRDRCCSLLDRNRQLIAIFVVFTIAACTPVPPKVITISKSEEYRPAKPDDIKNVEQAIATVMTAAADVDLPRIRSLSLWLYENSEAFSYWGFRNTNVGEIENTAAMTSANSIHINLGSSAGARWNLRIGELAHEFGHALHNSLADNEVKAPIWFREGFAEWAAARILDTLKWRSLLVTIQRARRELEFHGRIDRPVFRGNESWKLRLKEPGGFVGTYTVAFLGVDQLIRKRGFPAAVEYLKTAEFEKSFGESSSSFEAAFEKLMIRDLQPKNKFKVDKPKWSVGFQWKYEVNQSGELSERLEEIVGMSVTPSGSVYWLRDGEEETARSTDDLGIVETRRNGILASRRDKSSGLFAWPLEAGKRWTSNYMLEDAASKKSSNIHRVNGIIGLETVTVPAGTFNAIKLETYNYRTGRLIRESWYSPDVRWFVKTVSYESVNAYYREERLVSYKIDTQVAGPKK